MLRSFTAKNFRCFRDLTVEPLARVNLIAGKNNVGKTALLEALFLHAGANNPRVPLSVNLLRGIEQLLVDAKDLWGWLFRSKRTSEAIELASVDDHDVYRRLRISLAEAPVTTITPITSGHGAMGDGESVAEKLAGLSTATPGPSELRMEYDDSAGRTSVASASLVYERDQIGLRISGSLAELFPQAIFMSTRFRTPAEDAARFSRVVEAGREDELLETVCLLDPHLRRLMVLIVGGVPMIAGVIGAGPPVPLPLMGEGLVRLLSILLAIADAPGGTVLIDEIENGLHYSTLARVWRDIGEAARRSNTQVFATTHSWECIRAAYEAFGGAPDDEAFCFLRLERADNDIRAAAFTGDLLGAAVETGLEVR